MINFTEYKINKFKLYGVANGNKLGITMHGQKEVYYTDKTYISSNGVYEKSDTYVYLDAARTKLVKVIKGNIFRIHY